MQNFAIHSANSSEVIELRHQVLRPHQNLNECMYDVDKLLDTIHWKVCNLSHKIIGVITLFPETLQDQSNTQGYRIRGMAVSPHTQGMGVGATLLEHALKESNLNPRGYVWCNARSSAIGFYQKNGFEIYGEPFNIQGIGEHFIAKRSL